MLEMIKYLTIMAVLCMGFTLTEGDSPDLFKSPLVKPTETLFENYALTCSHLNRNEEMNRLLQNLKLAFYNITAGNCFTIAIGQGKLLNDKILGLFFEATDRTYPNSTMEKAVYKAYFTNLVTQIGISKLFIQAYGGDKLLSKLLEKAMKMSCKTIPQSDDVCSYLIPMRACLGKSLEYQPVFDKAQEMLNAQKSQGYQVSGYNNRK